MNPTPEEIARLKREITKDPALIARARDKYSKHLDDLFDKATYWKGVWVEYLHEYQKAVAKRQLELEKEGKASTAAESTAKAELIDMRHNVANAEYVYKFYRDLLRRLTEGRWD